MNKNKVTDYDKIELMLNQFADNVRTKGNSIYIKGRRYIFNDKGELRQVVEYDKKE